MFESVLVANRGEIACRIFRTAKALGMRTIAVYSEADAEAPFVAMADEAFLLGPAAAAQSYLRIDRIIEIARESGAKCIHPGYGFLSERAEFAAACDAAGVTFIGPPPAAIAAMGLKGAAKELMLKAGVPVVPGYHGEDQDPERLQREADAIGYPVLIKAVAGGGGKGMRRVDQTLDFQAALQSAQREATNAFGNDTVLIEKYVLAPRHIEVQVFADAHGNVLHLNERDCSLQRRHQKVIEEAPAPGITPELRSIMGEAAIAAAKAVGYRGAGTVEFIVDGRSGLRPDSFYFMEMNTRLQVEHPVTEAITGLDLVALQFAIAAGEAIPFTQDEVRIDGHAFEARVYAEDPEQQFLPSTGKIWRLNFPEGKGIRVDAGVEEGGVVTPFYDPMIAKVISHAPTRDEALRNLDEALGRTIVAGPKTNLAFLRKLCQSQEFRDERFDTGFIDGHLAELGAQAREPNAAAVAAAVHMLVASDMATLAKRSRALASQDDGPWAWSDRFQMMGPVHDRVTVDLDGVRADVELDWTAGGLSVKGADDRVNVVLVETSAGILAVGEGRQVNVRKFDPFAVDLEQLDSSGAVKAPMHGQLSALLVAKGEVVQKGQRLAVVEAMKMEHALLAPFNGTVESIAETEGQQVEAGEMIVTIAPAGEPPATSESRT